MAERKRPEERREEILRAAGEVVLRAGFGRTSARELAAELEVSPGLLHHYFPSLDEVKARAVELFSEEDLAQLADAMGADGDDPLLRLDRLLRFCEPEADDPSCRFWIESWAQALRDPAMREPTARLNRAWHDVVVGVVQAAVAAGTATCDDPDGAARRLLALVDGLMVQVLVHHELVGADLVSMARAAVEAELALAPGTMARLGRGDVGDAAGTGGDDEPHRRVRTARDPA